MERLPYQEPGSRTRYRYVLTPKGLQLVPGLLRSRTGATVI
jgi:hypothetical protein